MPIAGIAAWNYFFYFLVFYHEEIFVGILKNYKQRSLFF